MCKKTRIEVGDSVNISIDAEQNVEVIGTVLHIPSATGDCWHIRQNYGKLCYVQQFHFMECNTPEESEDESLGSE